MGKFKFCHSVILALVIALLAIICLYEAVAGDGFGAGARLRVVDGAAVLVVGDRLAPPVFFRGAPELARGYPGVPIQIVPVALGGAGGFWRGVGEYDFGVLDVAIESALADAGGLFILEFQLASPPEWLDANSAQVARDQFGEPFAGRDGRPLVSIYSGKFHDESMAAMLAAVGHIRGRPCYPALIGFSLVAEVAGQGRGEANRLGDYSPAATIAFREFLRREFRGGAATRIPDELEGADFASSRPPPPSVRTAGVFRHPVDDFLAVALSRFRRRAWAEALLGHAAALKEAAGKPVVVMAEAGDPLVLAELALIEGRGAIDFTVFGSDTEFPFWMARNPRRSGVALQTLDLAADFAAARLMGLGAVAAGRGGVLVDGSAWNPSAESAAAVANELRVLGGLLGGGGYPPAGHKPELAVVLDTAGFDWLAENAVGLDAALAAFDSLGGALATSGIPYDLVYLGDLLGDEAFADYRMLVFANVYQMDSRTRDTVAARVKNGGRLLLWLHAPGIVGSQSVGVENIFAASGFQVETLGEPSFDSLTAIEGSLFPVGGEEHFGFGEYQSFAIVEDGNYITPLALFTKGGGVGFAVKDYINWKSALLGAPGALTPLALGEMARLAGAAPLATTGVESLLGDGFVALAIPADADFELNPPPEYSVGRDLFSGEIVWRRGDSNAAAVGKTRHQDAKTMWLKLE